MKIAGISVARIRIKLISQLIAAIRRTDAARSALIRLETDTGLYGYGEAALVKRVATALNSGAKAAVNVSNNSVSDAQIKQLKVALTKCTIIVTVTPSPEE